MGEVWYYFGNMPREESKEVLTELLEEKVPVVEVGKEKVQIPPETHLEKIEKELHTIKPVRDGWGRIIAQPPTPKKVKITLPIARQQYAQGFSQPVVNSLRWLVVWIGRLVKMVPERVVFRGAHTPARHRLRRQALAGGEVR